MKARVFLPGLSRAILYLFLAAALSFPAFETVSVHAASTISLRAVRTANNQAGAPSLVLPAPGNLPGDVLIAQVAVNGASTSISAPSGWQLIRKNASNVTIVMATYYKVVTGSEPSSYTWSLGSSQPATGGIASFSGVNTAHPIDGSTVKFNWGSASASFWQLTTSVPNDMLLAFVGVVGNTTVTPPSGSTEAYDRPDWLSRNGRTVEMSWSVKSTAGQTSVGSAHEDTLSAPSLTQLVALRPTPVVAPTPTPTSAPIVIAAVGDMECQTADCNGVQTPNQIQQINPSMVFPLGDQVWIGYYSNFVQFYDPLWGPFRSISHPALGNHDGNAGYFQYWNGVGAMNGRAGPTGEGWYSFSKGTWHFVVLNTNCVGTNPKVSCAPGSPQMNWLQSDLAAHPAMCTIVFTHIPYYTSGILQFPELQTMFQILYNNHVELLITGHTHYYQRFYPQDASGNRVANGVTEIVAGTGGGDLSYVQSKPSAPNQAVQIGKVFGVLKLTLLGSSYSYRFLPAPGYTGSDSGSGVCH